MYLAVTQMVMICVSLLRCHLFVGAASQEVYVRAGNMDSRGDRV